MMPTGVERGLRLAVTSILEPTYSVDLGRSLAIWGHLSAVPTLLNTFAKIAEFVNVPALVQTPTRPNR